MWGALTSLQGDHVATSFKLSCYFVLFYREEKRKTKWEKIREGLREKF
jgi:hypothetical protein